MSPSNLSRRRLLRLFGVGLTTVVAGCGASDSETPTEVSSRTTTAAPRTTYREPSTDTDTPTPESTAAGDLPSGKLVPTDGDPDDNFGSAVAVTADRALVGAVRDEDPNGSWAGSAYVFERRDGAWTQAAKLVADDGDTYDRFGNDVALSDGTALVGALDDSDPNGEQAGAVYVFDEVGGEWVQRTKLLPADGDSWDHFGAAVSLSGDRAVVGAPLDEDPSGGPPKHGAGSAYVFERAGDEWVQQAKLAADDGDRDDSVGGAVAQSGATVLVGADNDDQNGRGSGAAYVFEQVGGEWVQQAKLLPDDGDGGDGFGGAVTLADDIAVVAAEYDEDPNGRDAGAVYVFERRENEWVQRTKLAAPNGAVGAQFGQAVAMTGEAVLVGSGAGEDFDAAHEDRATGASGTGIVYAYRPTADGGWALHEPLTAADGDAGDLFGTTVAADETTVLVGAVGDEHPHGDGAGSAYALALPE